MATHSETVYTYNCDLCGDTKDETELAQLFGPRQSRGAGVMDHSPRIDICTVCRNKPVSDVLAWMDKRATE